MCNKTFKAEVFSGKNEGEFFVSIYSKNIKKALGFTPFPGTLNARLISDVEEFNNCLSKSKAIIIDPPNIPNTKYARVIAYPILLFNSLNAYILRPEITIYKKDVVEIIFERRLRDVLNINDGSIIDINVILE
ncbi:MAG: DUF120 domain-containing protein [Caldisphaera sp.]|uniref:DUF120 domain-containing protein n=1 Tax=Caldisphaera sp. TaxID=2060322 RepID=UPI003D14A0C7